MQSETWSLLGEKLGNDSEMLRLSHPLSNDPVAICLISTCSLQ